MGSNLSSCAILLIFWRSAEQSMHACQEACPGLAVRSKFKLSDWLCMRGRPCTMTQRHLACSLLWVGRQVCRTPGIAGTSQSWCIRGKQWTLWCQHPAMTRSGTGEDGRPST